MNETTSQKPDGVGLVRVGRYAELDLTNCQVDLVVIRGLPTGVPVHSMPSTDSAEPAREHPRPSAKTKGERRTGLGASRATLTEQVRQIILTNPDVKGFDLVNLVDATLGIGKTRALNFIYLVRKALRDEAARARPAPVPTPVSPQQEVFELRVVGLGRGRRGPKKTVAWAVRVGEGRINTEQMRVLAGSEVQQHTVLNPSHLAMHNNLVEAGIIARGRITKDHTFSSPTAAYSVLRGSSGGGVHHWKRGRTNLHAILLAEKHRAEAEREDALRSFLKY